MSLIESAQDLHDLCQQWQNETFITVDTEFLRDRTYYPKLCLIQIGTSDGCYAIDPLNEQMDLAPLLELMNNPNITKVFHAARQDIEIIHKLTGKVPAPLFDTQIAAMVCGFGQAVSYARLAMEVCHQTIDKSHRFTDWSKRPLSPKQLDYALSDVSYLRDIYQALSAELDKRDRSSWLAEEIEELTSADNYEIDVSAQWQRLNPKYHAPEYLAVLQALTKWRELAAQQNDRPRGHIVKDHILLELAAHKPTNVDAVKKIRGLGKLPTKYANGIIGAIEEAKNLPKDKWPSMSGKPYVPKNDNSGLVELLKVLLKSKSDEHEVAAKMIACVDDLTTLANIENSDRLPLLKGWRYKIFGQYALALKEGKIALSSDGQKVIAIDIDHAN